MRGRACQPPDGRETSGGPAPPSRVTSPGATVIAEEGDANVTLLQELQRASRVARLAGSLGRAEEMAP